MLKCTLVMTKNTLIRAFNLFAGVQYTSFEILRNDAGVRIYGSFQGGQWYEFAHSVARSKSTGNGPVSVYPLIGSCDVTYGRKNLPMYPYIVAAGCVAWELVLAGYVAPL